MKSSVLGLIILKVLELSRTDASVSLEHEMASVFLLLKGWSGCGRAEGGVARPAAAQRSADSGKEAGRGNGG